MGKLGCACGNTISDSTSPSPNAAMIYTESETDMIDETFSRDVEEFLLAVKRGERDAWILEYFGDMYPGDLSDVVIITDIHSRATLEVGRCMLTCQECGRIHIQETLNSSRYIAYEKQA